MSESIFPFIDPSDNISAVQETIPREYAWDYEKNDFLLKDGKFQIVEGTEAIRVWAWKALNTQRYRYMAYSWDYGHELEELTGQQLSNEVMKSEVERYLKEVLSVSPYIDNVTISNVSVDGSKVSVDFKVNTKYGEVDISV